MSEARSRNEYMTKRVSLNGETVTLYSLNGVTWISTPDELPSLMERLENARITLGDQKGENGQPVKGGDKDRFRARGAKGAPATVQSGDEAHDDDLDGDTQESAPIAKPKIPQRNMFKPRTGKLSEAAEALARADAVVKALKTKPAIEEKVSKPTTKAAKPAVTKAPEVKKVEAKKAAPKKAPAKAAAKPAKSKAKASAKSKSKKK